MLTAKSIKCEIETKQRYEKNNLVLQAKRVSQCAKWSNSTAGNNGIHDTCWANLASHWLLLIASRTAARIDGSLFDVDFFVPRVRVYLISLIAWRFRAGHNITALHIDRQSIMIPARYLVSRMFADVTGCAYIKKRHGTLGSWTFGTRRYTRYY